MKRMFFYFVSLLTLHNQAQVKTRLDKVLNSDDSTAIVIIATYPDSIKPNILQACQKPEVLVKAEALQKSTSQSFRDLAAEHSKEEQKKLWDLARYPGLLNEITIGGKKSREELEVIAAKYPAELKKSIIENGRMHHEVLTKINTLYANSQTEFEKIIADYPEQTKTAYRSLIKRPDVLNTLSNNMHLAVILGDMYKSDPKQTMMMLDSIKQEHAKQSAKDLEDWKNGLEKNPAAKKELEQAGKEFAQEHKDNYVYDDDVYNTGGPSNAKPHVYESQPTLTNYYVQPYPYWFGYPVWYDYPYWYPYPYWYNLGFYWGPSGMVYTGFPSPYFMHWYLYHPYNNYYYSNFTDYSLTYTNSHYGPRNSRTGFNSEVTRWSRANEPNLPKGFFNGDPQRPQRIRELGKFETDYHNNTKGVFGKNLSRSEFLKHNSNYYPQMNPVISGPRYNQTIKYPQQQNPVKFNMGQPNNFPSQTKPAGMNAPHPQIPSSGGGVPRPRR